MYVLYTGNGSLSKRGKLPFPTLEKVDKNTLNFYKKRR